MILPPAVVSSGAQQPLHPPRHGKRGPSVVQGRLVVVTVGASCAAETAFDRQQAVPRKNSRCALDRGDQVRSVKDGEPSTARRDCKRVYYFII